MKKCLYILPVLSFVQMLYKKQKKISKLINLSLLIFLCISLSTSHLIAQIDTLLIGNWSGEISQPGFGTYPASMTINNLVVGEISGETEYLDYLCVGSITFNGNVDSVHIFSETITTGIGTCSNGRIEIFKLDSDSIQYNWYYSGTNILSSFGILGKTTMTGVAHSEELYPNSYKISEIYPNPFTDKAWFDFEIEQSENINIALYDIAGRKVNTIYKGKMPSGQKQIFTIDGNAIHNGYYILEVIGSDFQIFKKVILSK